MFCIMLLLDYAQCHPVDDVFYPKNLLKFWSQNGIDITGLDAIPGRFQATESKKKETNRLWTLIRLWVSLGAVDKFMARWKREDKSQHCNWHSAWETQATVYNVCRLWKHAEGYLFWTILCPIWTKTCQQHWKDWDSYYQRHTMFYRAWARSWFRWRQYRTNWRSIQHKPEVANNFD